MTTPTGWREMEWQDCGELIAVDDGYEEVAQGILAAVQRGPGGTWRFPWHAVEGGRPENAFSGRPFKGQNLVTLWAAARRSGFKAHQWANRRSWEAKRGVIRAGEEGTYILVPVFDEEGPATRWSPRNSGIVKRMGPLGGDAEGGEMRKMLGFRREQWFNVSQISGVEVAPPARASESEAAERLNGLLAGWRSGRQGRGPALVFGGTQAHWRADTDRVCMPPVQAFPDFDGLSGLEFYSATLAHEHVHATGSQRRLARDSLKTYGTSKVSRAREELVAELGAAFLCSSFGLKTALRPDHAQYVASWMGAIGNRNQHKAFFWAVREAEKAVEFIKACAGGGG